MKVYSRRATLMVRKPYDAEIEYLQSADSSSQYIDTGIQADSSTTSVYLDISFSGSYRGSNGGSIFKGNDASNLFACNFGSNSQSKSIYAWFGKPYGSGGQIRKIDGVTLTRGIMSYNNRVFSYGGKSVTTQVVAGKRNANLHILENFKSYSIARLYGGGIKENGVTIMDLIPVRVGTVGYLYDRISKTLLANGGTDPFIVGPDK